MHPNAEQCGQIAKDISNGEIYLKNLIEKVLFSSLPNPPGHPASLVGDAPPMDVQRANIHCRCKADL
jgi:hypothetical protein